jgi:hypothetical protein
MHRVTSIAVFCLALTLGRPLFAQSSPWLSIGGGLGVNAAQDKSYTSSTANAEHVALTWTLGGRRLTTEATLIQSRYGDADTCTLITRPCPQIYGLAGGAILLPFGALNADGTPQRLGAAIGAGMYSVRPPKTGNRLAPALQADFDLTLVQQPHMDFLVLGIKAIVLPSVRGDLLIATPVTIGIRWR